MVLFVFQTETYLAMRADHGTLLATLPLRNQLEGRGAKALQDR